MKKLIPTLVGLLMLANSGCATLPKQHVYHPTTQVRKETFMVDSERITISYPSDYKLTEDAKKQWDEYFGISKLAAIVGFIDGSLEFERGNPGTHLRMKFKANINIISLDRITLEKIDMRPDRLIEGVEVSFFYKECTKKELKEAEKREDGEERAERKKTLDRIMGNYKP